MYTGRQISNDYGETWITHEFGSLGKHLSVLSNNDVVIVSWNTIMKLSPDGTVFDTLYRSPYSDLYFQTVVEHPTGSLLSCTYAPFGDGGIFRSDDQGATWDIVGWEGVFVFDLAIGPDDAVYAARFGAYTYPYGGIYKSYDVGETWEAITEFDLPAVSVVITPDGTIYGGIDGDFGPTGVYQILPNDSMQWVNEGLIQRDVEKLYLAPSGKLYARLDVTNPTRHNEFFRTTEPVYVGQTEIKNTAHHIEIYPNPAHEYFVIKSKKEKIEMVKLFSISGQLILTKMSNFNKDYTVDLNNIIPENYIVQIVTNSDVYSEKLTIN